MSTKSLEYKNKGSRLKKLNVKQKAFCEEMAASVDFSPSEAARKAGYKDPYQSGHWLMRKPEIQAYLGKVLKERMKRRQLVADDVLDHLRNALFLDPLSLFDYNPDGSFSVKSLEDVPPEVRRCITKLKCKTRENLHGEIETYLEIELMSKDAAMTNALKHLGLMNADNTVNVNVAGQLLDFDQLCGKEDDEEDVVEGRIEQGR